MKRRQASKNSASKMRNQILSVIRAIPAGKVATYGGVAKAAGFPRHARHVVATLRSSLGLPWHRVLGAGGQIKLRGDYAVEQRLRLQAEGIAFRGRRVDLKRHEFHVSPTKSQRSTSPKQRSRGGKR